ncbi:hypothetical protein RF11_11011 [Thelohanellus kitauei]|uniref:Uncharacterized protein n=1 Tax=Thelohanellus kitauei TaxID=669202 RepID=A0A0C2JW93_THEKT|nr:hypothetical protein RF11_11011 [Thelohanellus kitauei]
MNMFLEAQDDFDCDGDYNSLRDKFRRLQAENNKLALVLRETQIVSHDLRQQLNEEKNKAYFETNDDSQALFENYKHECQLFRYSDDKTMNEKFKNLQSQFLKKIETIEEDLHANTASSSTSACTVNRNDKRVVEEKNDLESLNRQLQETIDRMVTEVTRLEKDNEALQDFKKNFKDKSKQCADLEDRITKLDASLNEHQQKIQSYKFMISDKDRYISTLVDENRKLVQLADSQKVSCIFTQENSSKASSWNQLLELGQLISETFDQGDMLNRTVLSLKFNENSLNFMKLMHERFKIWMTNMHRVVMDIALTLNENMYPAKLSKNPENAMSQISECLETVRDNVIKIKKVATINHDMSLNLEMADRKVVTSSKVIDEQTILIGNLIKEIQKLKTHNKNQLSYMKQRLICEKERRLVTCAENNKYSRELECRIMELECKNRKLVEMNHRFQHENDNLSTQLKFLVKQKIHLSQQLEEYECHMMKNFNQVLFSDEANLIE